MAKSEQEKREEGDEIIANKTIKMFKSKMIAILMIIYLIEFRISFKWIKREEKKQKRQY